MKKFLCIIICFFTNVGYTQLIEANPESMGISSERLERITELSKEYINDFNIPGIVTIVSRKGKIVYYKAFGSRDVQGEDKLLKDDLFRIYSMTKPVTAVAIMQLYEQGKFSLNDPVSKFLPEFNNSALMISNSLSITSFLRPVLSIANGLEAAICIANFEPILLEPSVSLNFTIAIIFPIFFSIELCT